MEKKMIDDMVVNICLKKDNTDRLLGLSCFF